MNLLIDANLSPRLVALLADADVEAIHVGELGLLQATDSEIIERARQDRSVIVTADSDFPMILVLTSATGPSVIHLRGVAELTVEDHARLLTANLPLIEGDLVRGAIASLSPHRLAVRDLPVR